MRGSLYQVDHGATKCLGTLEGDWKVVRLSGLLPPMIGVWKEIRAAQGRTRIGSSPGLFFRLETRVGHIALIYDPPLSWVVDELHEESADSFVGRATMAGLEYGRFRMLRL